MFNYVNPTISKDRQVITDIKDTIHDNVSNTLDIENYVDNCLLYDELAIAEYYNVSINKIIELVRQAVKEVLIANN